MNSTFNIEHKGIDTGLIAGDTIMLEFFVHITFAVKLILARMYLYIAHLIHVSIKMQIKLSNTTLQANRMLYVILCCSTVNISNTLYSNASNSMALSICVLVVLCCVPLNFPYCVITR